jgi:hypothetical protein
LAILVWLAMVPQSPQAQGQTLFTAPGAVAGCGIALGSAGGTAWVCPQGDLRGFTNLEGGTHVYEVDGSLDHGKLRLNISPGVAINRNNGQTVREVIALSPAPGGGTVMYGGTSTPIASFVPKNSWWPDKGIVFYQMPKICNPLCRRVAKQDDLRRLQRRVTRLERLLAR